MLSLILLLLAWFALSAEECGQWKPKRKNEVPPWAMNIYYWTHTETLKLYLLTEGTLLKPTVVISDAQPLKSSLCKTRGTGCYPQENSYFPGMYYEVQTTDLKDFDGYPGYSATKIAQIKDIYLHPSYNSTGHNDNNLSLLDLESSIGNTPLCVLWSNARDVFAAVSWNVTRDTILRGQLCEELLALEADNPFTNGTFCANNAHGQCAYRLAAPLNTTRGLIWHLAAVRHSCSRTIQVFTDISEYSDWITYELSLILRVCVLPKMPPHGRYHSEDYRNLPKPGDIVPTNGVIRFICDLGYYHMGDDSFYCQNDFTWSPAPVCKAISLQSGCFLPELPANGRYSVDKYNKPINPGDVVSLATVLRYTCDEGYAVKNNSLSICQQDQTWSDASTCELIPPQNGCRLPEIPQNGNYTILNHTEPMSPGDVVPLHSMVKYLCEVGYAVSGEAVSECQEDLKWSHEVQCKASAPEVGCVLPAMPRNGRYIVFNYDKPIVPGDLVPTSTLLSYACNEGHTITGNAISMCQENFLWSPAPMCEAPKIEGGCELPPLPSLGNYFIELYDGPLVPGTHVSPYTILTYSCHSGYIPSANISYCKTDSTWSASPVCITSIKRGCLLPVSYSVSYMCWSSSNVSAPCGDLVPRGTTVTYQCKAYHQDENDVNYWLHCEDGSFDYELPKCVPECGAMPQHAATLIIHGQAARRNSFPWHVAVYQNNGNTSTSDWIQICGGSLVRSHLVISAGHCFYYPQTMSIQPADGFAVAVGKLYRTWEHPEDSSNSFSQKSMVKRILIPELYSGSQQHYQHDIAILELSTPIQFSDAVHPVCLDLKTQAFDRFQLSAGSVGKVTGWGITANGTSSDILQFLDTPVISYRDCVEEMNKHSFVKFLTQDKICSGYTNGSSVCRGDSGGGLVFADRQWNTREKWYLRGVVSVSPLNGTHSCMSNTYTAYTRVFALREWINDIFRQLRLH